MGVVAGKSEPIRYLGLQNNGNTCYCNSVLQALYHCEPFRERCLKQKPIGDGMFAALYELFTNIENSKKNATYVPTKNFVDRLRQENDLFRSAEHHDAHEFYNFLVNEIADCLEKLQEKDPNGTELQSVRQGKIPPAKTWIHDLFEGTIVYETRCLCCENVTKRQEPFLDLSVEIEQNSSLTACVKNFAAKETLRADEKYFCDWCGCLQEAERSLRLGVLPKLLTVHLKRFKFDEKLGRYCRLPYRVAYPGDFRIPSSEPCEFQRRYELSAVVVHIGMALTHGHYVCCIACQDRWYLFDDHQVTPIEQELLPTFYGASDEAEGVKCGYLLFYRAMDENDGTEPSPILVSPAVSPAPAIQSNNASGVVKDHTKLAHARRR